MGKKDSKDLKDLKEEKDAVAFDSGKSLCKLVKADALEHHWEKYLHLVENARFICRKCGRVANDEKNLCKPELLA